MEFKEKGSIYGQIAAYICDQVLMNKFGDGGKIPSIRELAITMQVNPVTVQRAYDFLQQAGIITNKRGVGYFTAPGAREKVLATRREQFMENDVPAFLQNMVLLKIPLEDILGKYETIAQKHSNNLS